MTQSTQSTPAAQQYCTRCKQRKDQEHFAPSVRGKNGEWCKACRAEYARDRRKAKPFQPDQKSSGQRQRCARCTQNKSLDEFTPSRWGKSGAWCRECSNIEQRERRGGDYDTDPSLPKAPAVIGECSVDGCDYAGALLRGMCRNDYAKWQKQNTNVSWITKSGGMICNRCREDKPLTEYHKDHGAKSGYRARCKSCCVLDQQEWRARNPEKVREYQRAYVKRNPPKYDPERSRRRYLGEGRNWFLVKQFGITEEEYDELFKSQGYGCAVCGRLDNTSKNRKMPVDHNHVTNQRRGILCGNCNAGIGMLGDDSDRLMAAAVYLLKYINVLEL